MTTTINASTSAGLVQTADTSGVLALQTAGTTAVTVDASQNVGIGTASPRAKVDVNGSIYTQWADTNFIGMQFGSDPSAYRLGLLPVSSTRDLQIQAKSADGFSVSGITFYTGTGPTERMRINSSGNVGIGTTAPTAQLHSIATSGTTTTLGRFEAAVGSYTGTSLIACNTLGASSTYNLFSCITDSDGDAGGPVTQFLVRGDGLVLINTTSTNYNEQLKIRFPNTQGIHLNESTSSSSVNYQYFTKGATPTNVGAIFYNGSVMAYQTTSDYRLKENIAPMTGALAKISALKPVTYTWKDNQKSGEGFIAHELQEHFPDAVSGIKDDVDEDGNPKYQGMDASILIATLTAAIQEQQALITQLQADVAALKGATP